MSLSKDGSSRSLDPYERLGNAIIIQAVKDYRKELKRLRKNRCAGSAGAEVKSIEKFFHSQLFGVLTNIDPDELIRKIREEVGL